MIKFLKRYNGNILFVFVTTAFDGFWVRQSSGAIEGPPIEGRGSQLVKCLFSHEEESLTRQGKYFFPYYDEYGDEEEGKDLFFR